MNIQGIDEKDNLIVELLRKDGRMSYSDIGTAVGLSRVAVSTRVKALEEKGIIKGYTALIDPQSAPEMMIFVTNIETKPEHFEEARQMLTASPEVVTLVQTTGNCHLLAICVSADVKSMRRYVNELFKSVPGLLSVNAHAVLDVAKGNILPD